MKKIKLATIIYSFLILFVVYIAVVGFLIYRLEMNNSLTQKTARYIPYPVAIIGGDNFIFFDDFYENLKAIRNFYENQDFSETGFRVDFKTADGQKRLKIKEKNLLNKMIEDRIIQIISNDSGIKITSDMASQELTRIMQEFGNQQEVKDRLQNLYGWNIEKFQEKIVKPDLYKEKLYAHFRENEDGFKKSEEKIKDALEDLKNNKNFAQTAEKYSDGETSKNKGELGWFSFDQIIYPVSQVAFSLKKGEQSEIIESSLGYHIIKIGDKKTEDGIDKVKVSQIFVKNPDFSKWLLEQEKNIRITTLIKGMFWNKDDGIIEFKDDGMKKFEENIEENSSGDISVMF